MKLRALERRNKALVAMIVIGALLASAAFSPLSTTLGQGGGGDNTLVSLNVDTAPVLDGMADEAVWADAEELVVSVVGGGANGDVKLKSVFTDTDVYVYAEWDDPTMSLTRGSGAWEFNPIPEDTMRAVWADTAPDIDGDLSDGAWAGASPLTVSLSGGDNPTDVTLRALYNESHIFIQKQWDDPTFSIARGSSWWWDETGDGGNGTWEHPSGHSEDRANLQWNIDAIGFESSGCMVKCHIDSYSYLENEDDTTDMWHMKAARSLPAMGASQVGTPVLSDYEATSGEFHLDGYTDDKHVTYDENEGAEGDGGRHGDEGSSTYSHNRNATKATPKYIETDPADWIDAMVLHQTEIDDGETITADPEDPAFNATNVADAWANYEALDAVVPERVLSPPTGSRGDIHEAAIWKDGVWTVELERLLETDNDDDVQFDDLDETYHFGVSAMDDAGGDGHDFHSGVLMMDFESDFTNLDGGSEDRLALLWEIGTITNFATDGCMVKCHPTFGGAGAFLEVDGEKGDMWHMKAARSLPTTSAEQVGTPTIDEDHQATSGKFTFRGFIDDKHVTYDEEPHEDDGGRHGDEGGSTYGRNRNSAKTGPLYIESDPADYLDAMVLQQSEIDAGETLEIASASPEELSTAWDIYEGFGAVIPERILRAPSGSRGDIMQAAVWEDGTWHTEITRKLVTGNDDDVQFDDLDAAYRFGVALMDDSGGGDHSTTGSNVFELVFYTPPTEYTITAGPIEDKDGNAIEGATVTVDNNGSTLSATSDANGTVSIIVPASWAGDPVTVTVTKDDYEDLTFNGTISEAGEFSPVAGTYPEFVKEEKKDDDSPGFMATIGLLALALAGFALVSTRRSRQGRR
jgi:hypothetical protein